MSNANEVPPGYLSPTVSPPPGMACDPERFILPGALGGALVGYFSGYFSPSKIPPATSPLPPSASPQSHKTAKVLIHSSALGWRVFKRMFVGSVLYPFLICQMQGNRKSAGLLQIGVAGAMCGAIFGLRGGPMHVFHGSTTFFAFASLSEMFRRLRAD